MSRPISLVLLLTALLTLVIPSAAVFGVPSLSSIRGGGLFNKSGKGADVKTADAPATMPSSADGKTYPPMSQEEVESMLDDVPVYSVTDATGQGVVLKNQETGDSVFYFYVSPAMANATMEEVSALHNIPPRLSCLF